eukprot:TRINITY_DN2876_c0_g2_i14.p1 TRINITY_DN2876_c0_g2~~TRINITY_DN2876_c0_g2_i14.p1  ORF type:complete len:267 (-),score=41.94 TRINITY_DN2876_c0_g2_i14:374-1174(-)
MNSPFRSDVLCGKVAFVTGGGSGIGLGICKVLGSHGAKIAILSRRKDVLDKATQELSALGITAIGFPGDVRKIETLEEAFRKVVDTFGRLDILVNNAAGNFMCSAEELSENGFASVLAIDLQGTFNCCKAALPYLQKSGKDTGALIINISATLHYKAFPFQIHAASAKAGIDVITQTLAVEWGDYGIRVVGIAPGPISDTPGGPGGRVFGGSGLAGEMKMVVPLGRYGTTDDIGYSALFLATAGSYISGMENQSWMVEGVPWQGSY